jgi:hypothetical protein
MKKTLILTVLALVVFALAAPAPAYAKEWSNGEKNVGYVLTRPFAAAGHVVEGIGRLFTGKPGKLLALPKTLRQDVFDTVEGVGRTVSNTEAIKDGDHGAVNTAITDAGVDWLVDGALYGAFGGIMADSYLAFGEQQFVFCSLIGLGSGALTDGMAAAGPAIDKCVEK